MKKITAILTLAVLTFFVGQQNVQAQSSLQKHAEERTQGVSGDEGSNSIESSMDGVVTRNKGKKNKKAASMKDVVSTKKPATPQNRGTNMRKMPQKQVPANVPNRTLPSDRKTKTIPNNQPTRTTPAQPSPNGRSTRTQQVPNNKPTRTIPTNKAPQHVPSRTIPNNQPTRTQPAPTNRPTRTQPVPNSNPTRKTTPTQTHTQGPKRSTEGKPHAIPNGGGNNTRPVPNASRTKSTTTSRATKTTPVKGKTRVKVRSSNNKKEAPRQEGEINNGRNMPTAPANGTRRVDTNGKGVN